MYHQRRSPLLLKVQAASQGKLPSNSSLRDLTTGTDAGLTNSAQTNPEKQAEKMTFTNASFVCDIEDTKGIQSKYGTWETQNDPTKCDSEETDEDGPLQRTKKWLSKHKRQVALFIKGILFLLYNVYLGFAVYKTWDKAVTWCEGAKFLTLVTIISYVFAFYSYIFKPYVLRRIRPCLLPILSCLQKVNNYKYTSRVVWCTVLAAAVAFLVVDTADNRYRLVSAGGLVILVFLGYVFSKHRSKIIWRHLFWGLTIQFCMGLLVLRWSVGQDVFSCLGDKVKTFLDVTDKGSTFVFGYLVSGEMVGIPLQPAVFAFKVLTVVIFFSFVVSLLYYYGVMQLLVSKLGWLLHVTIGTTACESMNAAGNVFLGMTEAPLLIRPFLPLMTKSELHAVMTGGFATIAGSVLAAYINFGINASHLLTASVMAAPAALAFSKLVYPETEDSQTQVENIKIEKGQETNALEAATNGASTAIALVSNIAANLIAFVAFVALVDTLFGWLGSLVMWNDLSFEWILSKIFIPVSLLMGVDWDDREHVANLIGLKTVVNEFVAYKKLADYTKDKLLSARSEAIATFALCGFSNISSIGIQLGALSAMAPDRKSDLSKVAVRAMITGTVVCFMNACVAGTLLQM